MKTFRIFIPFFIVLTLLFLGAFSFFYYQISMPLDTSDKISRTFIVKEGSGLRAIGENLEQAGLIKNDFYFMLYAFVNFKASGMQAGVYELSPALNIKQIIRAISGGEITGFTMITIPEGFTSAQIEARLIERGLAIKEGEFTRAARERSLEGFLFPDTYEFRLEDGTDEVINRFLINFKEKTGQDINVLGEFYRTLILASLIEREVRTAQDMKLVSGVLRNRLELGMALQVDATLVFITGKKTGQITNEDKFIDSPFNTYKYRGLPPSPIANPGLRAITAALEPTPTDYLYYLNAPDGTTIFSKTLDEHNANRIKYLSR